MIQMVGSSENEYHYVDFSQIAYDIKWEFPRENLELGKYLFQNVLQNIYFLEKGMDGIRLAAQLQSKFLKCFF